MQGLQLRLVERNYFDPNEAEKCPHLNLELWPGYDASILQHDHDILMNVYDIYKVMQMGTVYELMQRTPRAEFLQIVLVSIASKAWISTKVHAAHSPKTVK